MPPPSENCSNCFYVISKTTRLPRARAVTALTCHYETPSGAASTALWPPVEAHDWCGAWSSNGLPRYRVEKPTDIVDHQAAIAFAPAVGFTP